MPDALLDTDTDTAAEAQQSAGRVYDRSIRMLAHREHSAAELTRKLKAKGHPESVVAEVLDRLQAQDLQSDDRFAESFVRSRLNRGYGPLRIRQELSQRGISDALADDELTRTGDFWIGVARQARSKRFGEDPVASHSPDWNSQARFLARRGFPADVIYRVLGTAD